MQCTLQLHTMLTTLAQNLPDQSKFASYTPGYSSGADIGFAEGGANPGIVSLNLEGAAPQKLKGI